MSFDEITDDYISALYVYVAVVKSVKSLFREAGRGDYVISYFI